MVADDADAHQPEQQRNGAIDFIVGAIGRVSYEIQKIPRLHSIEEERPVVVHGRNVIPIITVKLFRMVSFVSSFPNSFVDFIARNIHLFHAACRERRASAADIFRCERLAGNQDRVLSAPVL